MTKKRGLASGRGLDALLGSIKQVQKEVETSDQSVAGSRLTEIALDELSRGLYQPRRDIAQDALADLAESIRRHGIMQPIVVREKKATPDGASQPKYEIIAGERRWRAAKLAGLSHIPAIIRDISDDIAIALALIENIQREDLNAMEQAYALQRFSDEFGMSHQEIAETVGKARATVSNLLRLIGLHDDVKVMLEHGDLDMGHARCLLGLQQYLQGEAARQVVARGLTVRQTEQLIRDMLNPPVLKEQNVAHADVIALSQKISDRLGSVVELNHTPKGKGKMTIKYNTLEELDGILARMQLENIG